MHRDRTRREMLRSRITTRTARFVLAALLLAIFFLVPWRSLGVATELLGVPFVVVFTVLYPGAGLTRLLRLRAVDAADALALWIVHGLAVVLGVAFVWALSGISIGGFALLIALVSVGIGLAAPPPDHTRTEPSGRRAPRSNGVLFVFMIVLMAVLGGAVYVAGIPLDFGKDSYDYIAYANEVAATGDAFPTTAFYRDPGIDGADLRKGLLHAVYGFYHGWLGIDTIRLFAVLTALLLVAAALVVYSTALRMFDD